METVTKAFLVTSVLDGDTFDVSPRWEWNGQEGHRVRPTGYDAPELSEPGGLEAKKRLERLILRREVVLTNAVKVDRGRLVCDVYVDGVNLAQYFTAY